jgi:hypothetical protein
MTNAWGITESEYRIALERSRASDTSSDNAADYWQLCRFYRGQVFERDAAARAVRMIRNSGPPLGQFEAAAMRRDEREGK